MATEIRYTIEAEVKEYLTPPGKPAGTYVIVTVSHPEYGIETFEIPEKEYSEKKLDEMVKEWIKKAEEERKTRRERTITI